MNIISVDVAEFKANFDFIMSLVAKGHTVKTVSYTHLTLPTKRIV